MWEYFIVVMLYVMDVYFFIECSIYVYYFNSWRICVFVYKVIFWNGCYVNLVFMLNYWLEFDVKLVGYNKEFEIMIIIYLF